MRRPSFMRQMTFLLTGVHHETLAILARKRELAKRTMGLFLILGMPGLALARPYAPDEFVSDAELKTLEKRVQLRRPKVESGPDGAFLARSRARLQQKNGFRVMQLGDSHIAADFISSMLRHRLSERFGSGGRGFVHIDQRWGFGGRRLKRPEASWLRDRIVDPHRAGRSFGFSGLSLEAKKAGAWATYRVLPEDQRLVVFYEASPRGQTLKLSLDGKPLGEIDSRAPAKQSLTKAFDLPPAATNAPRTLRIQANKAPVRLFGLSFESQKPGLLWDSIGPVGADAKVYLQLDRESFVDQLKARKVDLFVLMVGGNDALKIRKGWTTLEKVRKDHIDLIHRLRGALVDSECLIMAPMDAGRRKGRRILSQAKLAEVRAMQAEVAKAEGCAFWDTTEAMGGTGSVARWVAAGVMNKDLVHPKKAAADLLGSAFAEALLESLLP